MIIKPDYNLENIYAIDLAELKNRGIKNLLFDLDSTIMASKSGYYSDKTREWLECVKKNFLLQLYQTTINNHTLKKLRRVQIFLAFSARTNLTSKSQKHLWKNTG